jgi:hypothetical protein
MSVVVNCLVGHSTKEMSSALPALWEHQDDLKSAPQLPDCGHVVIESIISRRRESSVNYWAGRASFISRRAGLLARLFR